jgi:anti-sigma factor ChrR (cupin superfamily)
MHNTLSINSDFSQRVVVNTQTLDWHASTTVGVKRQMIERYGGEVARATSIVSYEAGVIFPNHTHDFGEEIFVLGGVLSDEQGQYGEGTYVKNPPGSSHAPRAATACRLLVKLRHMDENDSARVVVDTKIAPWYQGMVAGLTVLPLSEFGSCNTAMVRWAPNTFFNPHRHYGGEEIYVVDGVFEDEHGRYEAGTWIRSPHMSQHRPFSKEGCTILVKTGHLIDMKLANL